jgi:hypothetical protein
LATDIEVRIQFPELPDFFLEVVDLVSMIEELLERKVAENMAGSATLTTQQATSVRKSWH